MKGTFTKGPWPTIKPFSSEKGGGASGQENDEPLVHTQRETE